MKIFLNTSLLATNSFKMDSMQVEAYLFIGKD
jgi:hypothetical protein